MKSWKLKGLLALLLVCGVIAGLSWSGVINWQKTLAGIPLLGDTVFSGGSHNSGTTATVDSLKAENRKLQDEVNQLRQEATLNLNNQGNSGSGNQNQGGNASQNQGAAGTTAVNKQTYRKLADYYASMKPASAVAILKNQDPQTVAGILHAMDSDAAGAILAAMDAATAARTLNDIATIDGAENSNNSNVMGTATGNGVPTNNLGGGF